MNRVITCLTAGFLVFGFLSPAILRSAAQHANPAVVKQTVVLSAPVQVLMYFGDRFLAANVQSILAAGSETEFIGSQASYRSRSHRVVAELNPCHEDNYWIGNAVLSWGGGVADGLKILDVAQRCRFWDEYPPFFYGFNLNFFKGDIDRAAAALQMAAQRANDEKQAAVYKKYAVLIKLGKVEDARIAYELLSHERDSTKDPFLRDMLQKRVIRLKGLMDLREAQKKFESRHQRSLHDPHLLIKEGLLDGFPTDPLGRGYLFSGGQFMFNDPVPH